ncbi:uncharacterized protein DUF3800 [Microcella alkaliphila]|uniref:Uncharacterized protein DUF3800 n=1 Tax=Microcella alkaliphila TaxID=279828 RepID=A0A4Q7TGF0_9MICO|nr:DUF3800 domain-containing protein [Microcella alkaliphila]RZT58488.1 uncharacterized protein DUF3800 [Microcella alkaliphila]
MRRGDYIVYVDESGDHNLVDFDPQYPRFVLAFCIVKIEHYVDHVVPFVQRLKFEFFGHDMVVLHEREIRQRARPFDNLMNEAIRTKFMTRIDELFNSSRIDIVASVIRKPEFRERRGAQLNPYEVALEFGLERVFLQLQKRGQVGRKTFVVFEGRGRTEDRDLELAFRRILDTTTMRGMAQTLEFLCVDKKTNSSGLQIADLVARPIGIHDLRPSQSNHAWDVIEPKIVRGPNNRVRGYGLKIYP